jgi:glycine/D-amino acid oxidase-like deaminating enzyme
MSLGRRAGRDVAVRDAPGRILADAELRPFWLDSSRRPEPRPPLEGEAEADLVVVGAGLTGLWTALHAAEEGQRVVVLEGERVAFGASGRNGGFLDASLTHGLANGLERFPREIERLEELGRENLAATETDLRRHAIDGGWERTGLLDVATRSHEVDGLAEHAGTLRRFGWDARLLDRDAVRAEVCSQAYLGGVWTRDSTALVDPARLCWGLADAAALAGATLHEGTAATSLEPAGAGVAVRTPGGRVRARRCVLATSAFPPLVRAIRRYVVPVYDYVLVTEPLPRDVLAAIGWRNRQGISDSGNRFHYYRLTPDDRLLWGGYDAVYHFRNGMRPELEERPETYRMLARHLLSTFPQLEEVRVTHRWAGAIDTCSRFSVMFGRALGGRVVYVVGFTGLGLGASRFAARVALDLAAGRDTELTRLELTRTRPLPFPPEPLRWLGITWTRRALARADETGRRGLWLRALDRAGLGFDS